MAKWKFDPRTMMGMAIKAMRQSVAEVRPDGKASPLVGAVLVMPDGDVVSAARGELREGDHAEFTLIERKCRDRRLDGSVLFATLEPCAPGSRRHPKLPCAERIVLARIKEVWVGIEDPDPTVDRKGIQYLQDRGVTVRMFDRDLQEEIREANREFIEQAVERAEAARQAKAPESIKLSPLEDPFASAVYRDLSVEALEYFRKVAKIPDAIGSPEFHRRLVWQGLLKEEQGGLLPTGFGLVLFAKEPRLHMRQAGLLGTIHYADGREELRDFDGPQVMAAEEAMRWLRDKLPDPVDRTAARRKSANETLFELAREGVANALVHRDYGIEGAKCQLIATPETITVKSPGRPQSPITLEQLQSFTAPMLSRNPILHFVFAQMGLAEERGLGLRSMRVKAEKAGLPLPTYSWEDPCLVLTLYRSAESATRTLRPEILDRLNDDELSVWRFATGTTSVASSDVATALSFDARKVQRILKKLVDVGLMRRMGQGPATRYQAVRSP